MNVERIIKDAQSRFIGYTESRQSGNCHEGSRDWARGACYMLALEHERAGEQSRADSLLQVADRMAEWYDEGDAFANPIASVSVGELHRLMTSYTDSYSDTYRAMFPCSHSATCAICKDSPNYPCAHYCGDPCRGINDETRMALDALSSYRGEWERALKYIAKGAFIRSLNIADTYTDLAARFQLTSRNNPMTEHARLRSYDFGQYYAGERRAPRVDVSPAFYGASSLHAVAFMRRFADANAWNAYRAVYLYGASLPATVSARDFKRNHADMFAFLTNEATAFANLSATDADAMRDAFATWFAPTLIDAFRDRFHVFVRDYDSTLHEHVSRRDLMRILSQLSYDSSARNAIACYESLVSLASANLTNGARLVSSLYTVPFAAFVAQEVAARLASYDADHLRETNADRLRASLPHSYIADRAIGAWRRAIVARYQEVAAMRAPSPGAD